MVRVARLGRAVGCGIAYRLQHLAAVLSVSLLSARLLLEGRPVHRRALAPLWRGSGRRESPRSPVARSGRVEFRNQVELRRLPPLRACTPALPV